MKVAILGAGPVGLMAAHAVYRNGHEPAIFSKFNDQPSAVNPDMFLQQPLPGLGHETEPDDWIDYVRVGDAADYNKKVYGNLLGPFSWDSIPWGKDKPLWWLDSAYSTLWDMYSLFITERTIDPLTAGDIAIEFPLTLSTLSARAVCMDLNHSFSDRPIFLERRQVPESSGNWMAYNGAEQLWCRRSLIRGWETLEYAQRPEPGQQQLEYSAILLGTKVIRTTCDCHPAIRRVGRWAQYARGVLNHHAYSQTVGYLTNAGMAKEEA